MKLQPGLPVGTKINVNLKDVHFLEIGTKVWILNGGRRPIKTIITEIQGSGSRKMYITNTGNFYEQGVGYTVFFDKASAIHAYKKYRAIRRKRHLRYPTDDELMLYIALIAGLFLFYMVVIACFTSYIME